MQARTSSTLSSAAPTLPPWQAEIASISVSFGTGRLLEAPTLVEALGCRRVLLVSDPGLAAAGHLARLTQAFSAAELEWALFQEVAENPTTTHVEEGVAQALSHSPECIVALGGGSAMDCAKGINFLLTNGGTMADYWGFGKASKPLLPSIGIPTTAGTGSEAQSYAVITDPKSRRKMACGDPGARFRSVILDPELLTTVPPSVAAAAGMDAVAHAVESFVSTEANPVSRLLSLESWRLLDRHLESSLDPQAQSLAAGEVLLAAHLAGAAIEQSMLGAAHACANPLTATYDVMHGLAVGLMLPHVVRFNAGAAPRAYSRLASVGGLDTGSAAADGLASRIEDLARRLGLPARLRDLAVEASDLPTLARAASREWTAGFNPRPVHEEDFVSLYTLAF